MKRYYAPRLMSVVLVIALIPLFITCKTEDPPPKPVAYFTFYPNTNLVAPVTMTFTNKSENADTYLWAYGSGLTDTDKDIVLTASAGGTYTVSLTAEGKGGTDSFWRTIVIANPPSSTTVAAQATAGFTYSPNQNLEAPVKITFANTSINATGYKWDFGDGTNSTDVNPLKEFAKAGTYKVKLTATGKSNSQEFTTDITINSPVVSTGIVLPSVDKAVSDFMAKYNLPGVSIALVKDDRLVYAKGYGLADKATNTKVRPDHLFRLASVSKPITSVAIFKLIEEGKLSLDAKVFGKNAILGLDYGIQPYGKNIETITVRHLLQHAAGGWNNQQNDPMFFSSWLNYSQADLISVVLNTRPLTNAPGSVYDYSNFGYLVLGRVIEKVTGKSYRNYVRESILASAGISAMDIGGDTEAERLPNEVTYYDASSSPYSSGMKVRRMDAHGGWVASAPDLARLLVRVNGFSGKADILKAASLSLMTTPSSANAYYACGWQVNPSNNWWHTGSLPGTSTIWVRTSTGLGWVVLVNQRSDATAYFNDLDAMMWTGIQGISQWPNQDLF